MTDDSLYNIGSCKTARAVHLFEDSKFFWVSIRINTIDFWNRGLAMHNNINLRKENMLGDFLGLNDDKEVRKNFLLRETFMFWQFLSFFKIS